MNKPIIIIGNGGHASVLVETLRSQHREIIGYTAPQENNILNLPYLGTDDIINNYNPDEVTLVLGLGAVNASAIRKMIFEKFTSSGFQFIRVIHPTAIVSPSALLGQGVQIMAGVIVQTNVRVEANSILNTGSIVDHDCIIGKHVHLAPGTTLSGSVQIGDGCHIGTGASIIQGISIGNETLVGAGSVVLKDIESRKIVYGVPAKEV